MMVTIAAGLARPPASFASPASTSALPSAPPLNLSPPQELDYSLCLHKWCFTPMLYFSLIFFFFLSFSIDFLSRPDSCLLFSLKRSEMTAGEIRSLILLTGLPWSLASEEPFS